MAGRGPAPKPSHLRQRRNKVSTRVTVTVGPQAGAASGAAPEVGELVLAEPVTLGQGSSRPLPNRRCPFCLEEERARAKAPKKKGAKGKRSKAVADAPEFCTTCAGTRRLPWHPLTLTWWEEVWASPFVKEYIETDIVGPLYRLAFLYESFWSSGDLESAREIRLIEARVGLDIMARRGLQWETKRPAVPRATSGGEPAAGQAPATRWPDPRKLLFMKGASGA